LLGPANDKDSSLPDAMVRRRHRRLFVVKASNNRPLVFIYYGEGVARRSLARLLTRNAARRMAVGIAKLPELLRKADLFD
jgi:hypothetical protein